MKTIQGKGFILVVDDNKIKNGTDIEKILEWVNLSLHRNFICCAKCGTLLKDIDDFDFRRKVTQFEGKYCCSNCPQKKGE